MTPAAHPIGRLRPPLRGHRLACLVLLLLGAGCSRTEETVLSSRSTYAVLEIQPLSGTTPEGQRLGPTRVAVLGLVPDVVEARMWAMDGFRMNCPAFPETCDSVAQKRGALVLRSESWSPFLARELADWAVGEERLLRDRRLTFGVFHKQDPVLDLSGTEAEPAEARVRLVKKCQATVRHVKYASKESASSGIISYRKTVPRSWVELKQPECFEPSDLEYELLSFEERDARAQAEARAREAQARRERDYHEEFLRKEAQRRQDERAYRDERFAAFQAEAAKYAEQHPRGGPGWEALSEFERSLNPELAGLLRAAGFEELRLESHCITRSTGTRRSRGRCRQTRMLLALRWASGEQRFVNHPGNAGRSGTLKRAWLDEHGWLRVELGPEAGTQPESQRTDIIVETLTFAVRDVKSWNDPDRRRLPHPENWSFVEPRD